MGAGFHGGFGNTSGAIQNKAPVNALKDVRSHFRQLYNATMSVNL